MSLTADSIQALKQVLGNNDTLRSEAVMLNNHNTNLKHALTNMQFQTGELNSKLNVQSKLLKTLMETKADTHARLETTNKQLNLQLAENSALAQSRDSYRVSNANGYEINKKLNAELSNLQRENTVLMEANKQLSSVLKNAPGVIMVQGIDVSVDFKDVTIATLQAEIAKLKETFEEERHQAGVDACTAGLKHADETQRLNIKIRDMHSYINELMEHDNTVHNHLDSLRTKITNAISDADNAIPVRMTYRKV